MRYAIKKSWKVERAANKREFWLLLSEADFEYDTSLSLGDSLKQCGARSTLNMLVIFYWNFL